jgi:hypothetical protein
MKATVFYSWQSDHPATRNIIHDALKAAVRKLRADDSLAVEPRIDRALKDATGAVRIDRDIFARISAEECVAFVGDVSLVTAPDATGRRSPNPNVLVELGFALRQLQWERLVLPFNKALGDPTDLPFDLEKNRLLLFTSNDPPLPTDDALKSLADDFVAALKPILALPGTLEHIAAWLDELNPKVLSLVRGGASQVRINVSMHRIPGLLRLPQLRGAADMFEFKSNQSFLANETCSNGGVNDLAGGPMVGFTCVFKDPNRWRKGNPT